MGYIFYMIKSGLISAILIEMLGTLFVIWGFQHKEKFVRFEDRVFSFFLKKSLELIYRIKERLYLIARKTFIFFYRPYIRMKKRILKRLLCQFGLTAVKINSESDDK